MAGGEARGRRSRRSPSRSRSRRPSPARIGSSPRSRTAACDAAELRRRLADGPVLATPQDAPRPRFPYIYDPDGSQRCPVVALLDGPRSPKVAELLDRLKERDRNLADAVVLGADVDMLDSLERLGAAARVSGRTNLADMFEHDRRLWRARADAARGRQRLEGSHYHWLTDNVPPEGIDAAEPRSSTTSRSCCTCLRAERHVNLSAPCCELVGSAARRDGSKGPTDGSSSHGRPRHEESLR